MIATLTRIMPITLALTTAPLLLAAQAAPVKLADAAKAREVLQRHYPENLRLLGIGGSVRVNVHVDAKGKPDSVEIVSSSGIPSFDRAARMAAREFTFSRPRNAIWLELPLTFASDYQRTALFPDLPALSNRDAVLAAFEARLSESLRRNPIDGMVSVLVAVDSTGKVTHVGATGEYCLPELGEAALAGAAFMQFPAVAASTAPRQTIGTFDFEDGVVTLLMPGEVPPLRSGPADSIAKPQLRNADAIGRALQRHYPVDLRDRGIGGTVSIWFLIDEQGVPVLRRIKKSSDRFELDRAAFDAAAIMLFQPATRNGKPIQACVDMPIVFRTR